MLIQNFVNRYRPGHVLVFRSSALYHAIAPWKGLPMKSGDYFIPGRIAWVFFNHKKVVNFLQDKPKNWFRKTGDHKNVSDYKGEEDRD